jgi:dihydrofolate reductase
VSTGRVVASIGISLDGFIEGPERQIDWHRIDAELHQYLNDDLRSMAGFVEGRVTYELMAAYWPTADADPDASPQIVDFAQIWRGMPKVVLSRTMTETDDPRATIRREIDPDEIRALTEQGDIVIGGADVITAFRELDLVDDYRVYVHPVLIGRGKRLFPDTDAAADLRLVDTRIFGNGVVRLHYLRASSTA